MGVVLRARDTKLDRDVALLAWTEERHRAAAAAFREAGGDGLLGVTAGS